MSTKIRKIYITNTTIVILLYQFNSYQIRMRIFARRINEAEIIGEEM